MSKSDAWMPLYWGDYLRDTVHLTATGHGGYLLLIGRYWTAGSLPNDDAKLAAFARMTRKEWAEHGETIKEFFTVDGDMLRHKRIDAEKAKTDNLSSKRSAVAKARWSKDAKQEQSKSNAIAYGLDAACTDNHNHNHIVSDAVASGGAAPPMDLLGPKPRSAREALFSDGLAILLRLTGVPEGRGRSALGGLLKGADDDCARVMAKLREAETAPPADPMAWLTAACRASGRGQRDVRQSATSKRLHEMLGAMEGLRDGKFDEGGDDLGRGAGTVVDARDDAAERSGAGGPPRNLLAYDAGSR